MQQNILSLNDNCLQCHLSPLVVMSVLNHYQRRPPNFPFVIGIMFGHKEKNNIYISDCFPIVIQFDDKEQSDRPKVRIHEEQNKKEIELIKQHWPNSVLIGWYKTGLNIEPNDVRFHSHFREYAGIKKGAEDDFIYLLIDTDLSNHSLNTKAYVCTSMRDPLQVYSYQQFKKNQRKAQKEKTANEQTATANANVDNVEAKEEPFDIFCRFMQISMSYYASESEKIGIDMIIKSPPEGQELDSPSVLMSDVDDLELTLQELLEKLQKVERYVRQIQDGTIEGDESLGWMIGEALSSVPTISPPKFEKMLSNRLQDLLMIVYLGKLSRAQLTIADKINQVLHIQGPQ